MSKKLVITAVVVGVLIGVVVGVVFFVSKKSKTSSSQTPLSTGFFNRIQTDEPVGDLLYKDEEVGFSFRYPKGIEVRDTTPDDTYYIELTLTKGGKIMKIAIQDTESAGVDDYVKGNALLKGASLYGATKLAGLPAKEYAKDGLFYTIALDQGIVYQMEGAKDGGYWEKTQNIIVDSFLLLNQQGSSSGSGDVIYEEEEVVE